jgi:UDP-4-amino-4,6-dideoxy-N-acetyl-beta-L-altrosamine N-acetyltransferase
MHRQKATSKTDRLEGSKLSYNIQFKNILACKDEIKELVRTWRNSEGIRKYMYNDHLITVPEHLNWLENLGKSQNKQFWVIFADKIPIGACNLNNTDYINKNTDWGLYIGDERYYGKGIGSASLYKLMRIVFDEMRLDRMYTKVLGSNTRAMTLYKEFGFVVEGELREHLIRDGKRTGVYHVGILRKEWEAIKSSLNNRFKEYSFSVQ